MEENLIKTYYENELLTRRYTEASAIIRLLGKTNVYGEKRGTELIIKRESAASVARVTKADMEVTKGIASGIELGQPIFDEIGEEFLKSKIPGYRKSDLGVALTKTVLHDLNIERVDEIVKGVKDAIENKSDMSEEARIASFACQAYDLANKYKNNIGRNMEYENIISDAQKTSNIEGVFSVSNTSRLEDLEEKETEREEVKRDPNVKKELETVFDKYANEFDKIPSDFKKALEGYTKPEITAYYIMSLTEQDIHEIYVEQESQRAIDEM